MKNSIFIIFLIGSITILSCNKEEEEIQKNITYPLSFDTRLNVLIDSSFSVRPGIIYSISADLPKGTSIKILCKPSANFDWGPSGFIIEEKIGYEYHNFYPDSLIFLANGNNAVVNVPIMFGESGPIDPTSLDFLIYENGSDTITRIKTVRSF